MIGPKVIPANTFEKIQLSIGCYCQLTLKVKPSHVKLVHEISKKAVGCRTLFDGGNYVYTPNECPVFKISDNFPSLESTQSYVATHFTLPESVRLASICYNNDTIILNSNHSSMDGGYMKLLLNYLTGAKVPFDPDHYIHESVYDTFSESIHNAQGNADYSSTKIIVKKPKPLKPHLTSHYIPFDIPINELSTFHNGKCKGMTDMIWSSVILSVSASNGEFTDSKVMTAVDLRRELKNPSWSNANLDSMISVNANGITKDSSVGEMKRTLRVNFTDKIEKSDTVFKYLRGVTDGSIKWPDYPVCSTSNIGVLKTGGDIIDVNVGTSVTSAGGPPGSISLNSICVDNKVFRGRLYCSPFVFDHDEAKKLAETMKYCLMHVKDDMKIESVVEDLKQKFHY
ncbi:hypothetical protein GPJ56_000185 [Histomonas meleagridis]|uniref:uncharacterized protein n=1 Tax=Histomonas meleagridis TaxID=135588 RepID=UPI0035595DDB|nr:hypothetical protein GPJ56_000185 [Histomonas meleagridis]KAH0799672.1 hypothetical protein GO595_007393 [Histomonas meleagridis]